MLYLVLAALALIPGVMLKFELAFGQARADQALRALAACLDDIRFGSGLRFWLGVSGATLMGLLLLYPVRKALAKGRWLGRIGGWFHIHIVFGIFGPVLIAYHSNFGPGGSNANVALWSMIAVAVSGIIGHFIYANVSASFYANKQKAREQLDGIEAALSQLNTMHASRKQIVDGLAAFEAELLTPRQGVIASLLARFRLETRKRQLARSLSWHLSEAADQLHMSELDHEQLRGIIGRHFGAYVRTARHASSRSIREQIWARWRLFHLPAFIIMAVATVLHVAAVWNMDGPTQQTSAPAPNVEQSATAASQSGAIDTRRVNSVPVAPPGSSARPVNPPQPKPAARQATPATETMSESPKLKVEPRPVTKSAEAPQIATTVPAIEKPAPQAKPSAEIKPPPEIKAAPPVPVIRPTPKPLAAAPPTPTSQTDAALAELSRRPEAAPMSLGGAKPRTLTEQIETLKARMKAKTFFHSDAETGFALTGKHTRVECASCHQKPFTETRSNSPRACIACHKSDDIHRGRRPDCASCHTTNRWSEIIKQR